MNEAVEDDECERGHEGHHGQVTHLDSGAVGQCTLSKVKP